MAGNPISFSSGASGDVTIHDLNTRKVLTIKFKETPAALQALRRNIIENANRMVQEMKKYRFNEVSEIVRVCTALGIERAYLRGLIHSIGSEEDIDRYIYRFNLNGALPFQDKDKVTGANWVGGGQFAERAFFYGTKNTILLQCLRSDGEPFYVCNGDTIEVASLDPPELPLTAFVPKYRDEGPHPNLPWLPDMKCDYLFNIPDPEKCVTTTDIASSSSTIPDLNELIPVNVNPFPYTNPNRGFPFYKVVNPAPKPIRMVMDGSPVDGERVILANRFELSGTVNITTGDSTSISVVSTTGLDYPTQIIPDDDGTILDETDIIVIDETTLDANTANAISDIKPDNDDNLPDQEDVDITTPPGVGDPGDNDPPVVIIETPTANTVPPGDPDPGPVDDEPEGVDPEDPTTGKPLVYSTTEGDPIDGDPDDPGDPPPVDDEPEGITPEEPPETGGEFPGSSGSPSTGDGTPGSSGSPVDDEPEGITPEEPPETGPIPVKVNEFPIILGDDGNYYSNVPIETDYSGEAYIKRDPVVGTSTRFDEELYPNDIVELQYAERTISGIFYTVGTNKLYYKGDEFINVFRPNIEIVMGNVHYKVTALSVSAGSLSYYTYKFNYDAICTLVKIKDNYVERSATVIPSSLFSPVSETVNVYPMANNKKLAVVSFGSSLYAEDYFEVGDLIQINGVYCRFKNVYANTLTGVYRVDGGDINRSINNATLTRATKLSRAFPDDEFSQAFMLPFRMYYKVNSINGPNSITVSPNFTLSQSYEGKLYRIGFNMRSVSQSPDLLNSGFNVDGVAQFLPEGAATDNSPVFFVPAAATERVILYNQAAKSQITSVPGGMSAKTALPVLSTSSALTGTYMNNVYNYTTFSQPFNTVIFPSDYNPIYDEEEKGQVYFTDGDDKYVILETIEENNPVSHGFGAGDRLEIRKVKYRPDPVRDDPYGDLIRHNDGIFSTHMNAIDYDDCGMLIEVADIVNPHRFKVLKEGYSCSSKAHEFFHAYDINQTYYLTATNGSSLEYWAKYFSPVYMDGTITANSYGEYILDGGNVQRTLQLCSKNASQEKLKFNYNDDAFVFSYWLGSTGVNIEIVGDVIQLNPGAAASSGATSTDDGLFVWSIKDDVVHPPNLLDTFILKVVEFEDVEI